MLGLLFLLFVVVPVAELYVIVQVSHGIGVPETILALVAVSMVGVWLAKLAGIGVLNRLQRTVRQGKVPSRELVDGALVLLAGGLLVLPGFLSDALAVVLLLPPSRAVVRRSVLRRIRAGGGLVTIVGGRRQGGGFDAEVWDVEGWEDPPAPPDRPELGR